MMMHIHLMLSLAVSHIHIILFYVQYVPMKSTTNTVTLPTFSSITSVVVKSSTSVDLRVYPSRVKLASVHTRDMSDRGDIASYYRHQ